MLNENKSSEIIFCYTSCALCGNTPCSNSQLSWGAGWPEGEQLSQTFSPGRTSIADGLTVTWGAWVAPISSATTRTNASSWTCNYIIKMTSSNLELIAIQFTSSHKKDSSSSMRTNNICGSTKIFSLIWTSSRSNSERSINKCWIWRKKFISCFFPMKFRSWMAWCDTTEHHRLASVHFEKSKIR